MLGDGVTSEASIFAADTSDPAVAELRLMIANLAQDVSSLHDKLDRAAMAAMGQQRSVGNFGRGNRDTFRQPQAVGRRRSMAGPTLLDAGRGAATGSETQKKMRSTSVFEKSTRSAAGDEAPRRRLLNFTIHPDGPLSVALDALYIVCATLYTLLMISVYLSPAAPGPTDFAGRSILLAVAALMAFTWVWTGLRFFIRTNRTEWEMLDDASSIRDVYMHSSAFALDVAVAVPLEFVFVGWFDAGFFALMLRHPVLRVARILQLGKSTNPLTPDARQWVYLMGFAMISIAVGHFTASLYWTLEEFDTAGNPLTYGDALYYAAATLTSVGFGDLVATRFGTRVFSTIMMIVGVILIASITAIATTHLSRKDALVEEQERKRRMMHSMLQHYSIPWNLQKEVVALFPTVLDATSEQQFKEMIRLLPSFMEQRVDDYLRAKLLRAVPLFADLGDDSVLLELSRRLKVRYAAPMSIIIQHGELGAEMFILVHGAVEVRVPVAGAQDDDDDDEIEEKIVATLRGGSFFGEIALIEDAPRTASIVAIMGCELLILAKDDFHECVSRSAPLQAALETAVRNRRGALRQSQSRDSKSSNPLVNVEPAEEESLPNSPSSTAIVDTVDMTDV